MSKCIPIKNGILCLSRTEFKCPKCGCIHDEDDYMKRLDKSENGLIYRHCKGCQSMLGITFDICSDIQVWLKSEESKFNQLINS